MQRCPHCETELPQPQPAICPSCGESLGAPPRRAASSPQAPAEKVLFEGHPAVVPGLGEAVLAVLTLGLALVWLWARSRASHYRLTTSRLVIEEGMFSKRLEQIDLYRVEDYAVDLPFSQRLLGTGNITLVTTDRTASQRSSSEGKAKGEVRLHALRTDVRALYEALRAATEADKARRGVRRFDSV